MVADMIKTAEEVIQALKEEGGGRLRLKTNQIRKILSAINAISNKVQIYKMRQPKEKNLPEELAADVSYLKVMLAYQSGRERSVREFVERAGLLEKIDTVASIRDYEGFARYMEALVAYHKYYGGNDL